MDPKNNKFWSRTQTPPQTPTSDEIFVTPNNSLIEVLNGDDEFKTPTLQTQLSNCSVVSDIFGTPDSTLEDVFTVVDIKRNIETKISNMSTITENIVGENSVFTANTPIRSSLRETKSGVKNIFYDGVIRSKSDFEIPNKNNSKSHGFLQNIHMKSELFSNIQVLSPLSKRRTQSSSCKSDVKQSTPKSGGVNHIFKLPGSPILDNHSQNCGTRAISLNSLRHSGGEHYAQQINIQQLRFVPETNIFYECL